MLQDVNISVILPTYNRANFIREAIDSVFLQDYEDMEIIVVDDGSTDNTAQVIEQYGSRIRYLRQDNAGLGPARNRAIQEARGRYLAFLDSDDVWLEDKIRLQLACMEANPDVDLCCTNFYGIDEQGVKDGVTQETWEAYRRYGLTIENVFSTRDPLSAFLPSPLSCPENAEFFHGRIFEKYLYGPLLLASTALMKKEPVLEAMPYMGDHSYTHDYFLFSFISKYAPVGFIDMPLCAKRSGIQGTDEQAEHLTSARHQIDLRTQYLKLTEQLWRDDPSFYYDHKKEVDDRLSLIHGELGLRHLASGGAKKSRDHYIQSIRLKPCQKRAYVYLLIAIVKACVPGQGV